MDRLNKLIFFAAGFAFIAGFFVVDYILNTELRAVQAGEARLVCFMEEGARVIEPSKVTGLVDGVWLFSNGYASDCEVIELSN